MKNQPGLKAMNVKSLGCGEAEAQVRPRPSDLGSDFQMPQLGDAQLERQPAD